MRILVLRYFIRPLTWLHAQKCDDVVDSFCVDKIDATVSGKVSIGICLCTSECWQGRGVGDVRREATGLETGCLN